MHICSRNGCTRRTTTQCKIAVTQSVTVTPELPLLYVDHNSDRTRYRRRVTAAAPSFLTQGHTSRHWRTTFVGWCLLVSANTSRRRPTSSAVIDGSRVPAFTVVTNAKKDASMNTNTSASIYRNNSRMSAPRTETRLEIGSSKNFDKMAFLRTFACYWTFL